MEPHRKSDDSRAHLPTSGTVKGDATQGPSPASADLRALDALTQPQDSESPRPLSELLPAAHEDIAAARAGGYAVKVLTKVVGGEEKIAVLFGEKHSLNDDSEIALASNVIRHFSTFAVEGIEPSTYVGGLIYFDKLDSLRKVRSDELGLNNKGSIDLTVASVNEAHDLAVRMLNDIHKAIQRGEVSINLDEKAYNSSPEVFKQATAIVSQVFADSLSVKPTGAPMQATKQVHNLEQDHRPTTASHLYTLNKAFEIVFRDFMWSDKVIGAMLLTTIGWCTLTAASSILTLPSVNFAKSACGWTALAYWATTAARVAFVRSPARKISEAIENSLSGHFAAQREETMARNSNDLALSEKVQGPLLVQMGAAHVEPVAQKLTHSFGWNAEAGPGEGPS